MLQRFLMDVPLNCDAGNVAGILDQLEVEGVRFTHLTRKDGERAEDLAFPREQGVRPNCTNAIRQYQVTIVVPNGLPADVGNIDRFPPINRRAAGRTFRAYSRRPYFCSKSGKTGSGCAM